MSRIYFTLISLLSLALLPAYAQTQSSSPQGAELYFITPEDGAAVTSPITVKFGLRNMGVAPAGINVENTGHHHLLIDTVLPALNQPIPADDKHVHFGKGQTEATLNLAPGTHTLRLLLGDHLHTPHNPPVMSEPITITVSTP
ncbi:MAG TPA: DUF4399 domain-containing protein [Gammaproteobacteria bacterium]|nr:DUF4399 domain-containing protein [Gammaproteobacteria bacterium]